MYDLKHISQIVRRTTDHVASPKVAHTMPKCPKLLARKSTQMLYSIYDFKQVPVALRDGVRTMVFFGQDANDYRLYPLVYWLALFMGLYGLVSSRMRR